MNAVLVDSSVVLDLFTDSDRFYEASVACMTKWGSSHDLWINDVIYAEASVGFRRIEVFDHAIDGAGFMVRLIPRAALFLAGKAFEAYRRRGGNRIAPLPDFFIGAHAAVERVPLITRDPTRVRAAFPTLRIVDPAKGR